MSDQPEKITLRRPIRSIVRLGFLKPLILIPLRVLSGFKGVIAAAIFVGGFHVASTNFGVPAFHYAYDYQETFNQQRYKTACRYLSPYGRHERPATSGRCAWIVLVAGEAS